MILKPNEQITEQHFRGTFVFPDDVDLIGLRHDGIFGDLQRNEFNTMIEERLKTNK